MATQYDPIAKDESLNTTEATPRNIADVLAEELSGIASALTTAQLASLADVIISSPSDGQTLKYDAVTQKWVNANDAGGHTIENPSGTDMTQRGNLQFTGDGVSVTDDAVNGKTIVDISPDAEDIPYDNISSGLSATDAQGAIDEVVSNVETIIQESVFTVEESGGVWYLYWHGATGECPWSVTQSGTDYELNFTYTTV